MITNIHYIELYINKKLIELESQESLNLRINNVLFDPTKTSTTQAEYSYSFDIPSTPNNDRILNYANNLSKVNKFRARYPAEVYADGHLIFGGSLTVQEYDSAEKMYSCNLVNIKINSLEDIFGDEVMTDLKWEVPFNGAPTINSVNADMSSKYYFPLVSYGVFQKDYVTKDEVGADYTPKHDIDKYNNWWVESFYPSLNVLEAIKRAYNSKGYNVGGSAFSDPFISNIYASCNLANDQAPIYNVGNSKFGELSLTTTWNNYNGSGRTIQELKFPYQKMTPAINASNEKSEDVRYNFDVVNIWNMCDSTNNSNVSVTVNQDTYMYEPNEHLIVIPSDGWYKINLTCNATLSGVGTTFTSKQWTNTFVQWENFQKRDVRITRTLLEHTPLEIQLIRNYDDNVELIKGKRNIIYATGDPNQETYKYVNWTNESDNYPNKTEWLTEYPHEDLKSANAPTKTEGLTTTSVSELTYTLQTEVTPNVNNIIRNQMWKNTKTKFVVDNKAATSQGYMHRDGYVMPYDQAVSPAFICGLSSLDNGVASVMKNGKSWTKMCSVNNKIFANVKGLDLLDNKNGMDIYGSTKYCSNEYKDSQCSVSASTSGLSGTVQCCVYLNKNDILELVAVQRDYDGSGFGGDSSSSQGYACSATCSLHITAMSQKTEYELRNDSSWGYNSSTQMPTNLNLFNFTNSETKVSDWISHVQKALNLEIIQDGNNIDINTKQGVNKNVTYAVDIDDRVSNDQSKSEFISYPREMSVQYKTNTDEWGYWLTVPLDKQDAEDWAKYGDSGFTVIKLNDDSYETSTQNTSTNFSYTWYDNFNFQQLTSGGSNVGSVKVIQIPVIEKYDYMAEGYDYEESAKHDGYSLTQRFWYRQNPSSDYVWLSSKLSNGGKEYVYLSYPTNIRDGFNLSYKDTEKSIVTEYFNIHPMLSSNYVSVDVYLTPEEYEQIKGGALVHYDSNLHYVSEISGYDPSGTSPTTLKLITKV